MIIDLYRDCSKDISSSNSPALSTGYFIRDFVGLVLFCLSAHRDFTLAYYVGCLPASSQDSNNPQQIGTKQHIFPHLQVQDLEWFQVAVFAEGGAHSTDSRGSSSST